MDAGGQQPHITVAYDGHRTRVPLVAGMTLRGAVQTVIHFRALTGGPADYALRLGGR